MVFRKLRPKIINQLDCNLKWHTDTKEKPDSIHSQQMTNSFEIQIY